jgi:hypothetical protein
VGLRVRLRCHALSPFMLNRTGFLPELVTHQLHEYLDAIRVR